MSVNILAALTDDAMANMYELVFPNGIPGGGGDASILQLRADQNIDIPARTITPYEVKYQGSIIPKTAANIETDKKFMVAFRIDANWEVWNVLKAWHDLIFNEKLGSYAPEADTRTTMILRHFGPNRVVRKQLKINGLKLFEIHETERSHDSTDPMRVECQFMFAWIDEEI